MRHPLSKANEAEVAWLSHMMSGAGYSLSLSLGLPPRLHHRGPKLLIQTLQDLPGGPLCWHGTSFVPWTSLAFPGLECPHLPHGDNEDSVF